MFSCWFSPESGSVEIPGANWTVAEGDQVMFQCVAANWFPAPQISWALDGTLVDQQFFNTSSVNMGTLFNANSTFWFTASRNISVACLASILALAVPKQSSVFLVVGKIFHFFLLGKVYPTEGYRYSMSLDRA